MKKTILILGLSVMIILDCSALGQGVWDNRRDYERDLRSAVGRRLSPAENEIAVYVLTYYCLKYRSTPAKGSLGEALSALSPEDYERSIQKAARVAVSPAAHGLLATGKKGEKLLKAIIVGAEDAVRSTDALIDRKASEYDERH